MKKSLITFLVIIACSITTHSQSKKIFYVDADYQLISFKKFQKKLKSKLFNTTITNNDTAIYKKLRYNRYFGKLEKEKHTKLNHFFSNNFKIDTTKILFIRSIRHLPSYNRTSNDVVIDSIGLYTNKFTPKARLRYKKRERKKHLKSIENFIFLKKKMNNNFNILKNVQVANFYTSETDFSQETLTRLKFYKDSNLILNKFFSDGVKTYNTIIIYPNGDFYVQGIAKEFFKLRTNNYMIDDLLTKKQFIKMREKWLKKINKLN